MKKRIGSLFGKPIIQGDINLKTSNEIHIKQLTASSGGSGGGNSDGVKWEYYKLDWDKINNLNLSDVKNAVSYSNITNCQPQPEGPKFISTDNITDWETYRYSKIGGTNARMVFIGTVDAAPKFIIDNNSWIANIKAMMNIESIEWLIPITEEEFFTFGDDSEYQSIINDK